MSVSLSGWKSRDFLESASPDDLEQCLSEGADPNVRIEDGETPLHVVGTREGVELLLDAGADPNARDETGQTPLHAAARDSECTPEEVELLLDAGADPNARDEEGQTPWDLIEDDSSLKNTDVYWKLNDARF